jgi:hypothetical protein
VTTLHLRARGPHSKYDIWSRATDPQRWPEWTNGLALAADDDRLRVGLEGTFDGWLGASRPFEVTEVDDRAMRWTWRVDSGRRAVEVEHDISDGYASATIRGPLIGAWRYLPVARRQLKRLVS